MYCLSVHFSTRVTNAEEAHRLDDILVANEVVQKLTPNN